MHVLNGFSTRRKSSKPKSLHIRKISFSGCSIDSVSSTSTTYDRSRSNSDASCASYDPLRLHPTVQPPPRLHERAYIVSPRRSDYPSQTPRTTFRSHHDGGEWSGSYGVSVFEYDDSDVDEDDGDVDEAVVVEQHNNSSSLMPPMSSPADHTAGNDSDDADDDADYLFLQPLRRRPRPDLARSRWSESTVQQLTTTTTPLEDAASAEQARRMLPNFSRKHATVPARPRMRPMDSVEQLVKSGGWKRKGLLLDKDKVMDECS